MRKWTFNREGKDWLADDYEDNASYIKEIRRFFNEHKEATQYLNNYQFDDLFKLWEDTNNAWVSEVLATYLKRAGIDFEDYIEKPEEYFYVECIKWEDEL